MALLSLESVEVELKLEWKLMFKFSIFLFSNLRTAAAARERADARGLHRRRRPPRLHDGRHPRQVRKKELGREVGGKANIVSIESQGEQSLRTFTLRRIPQK